MRNVKDYGAVGDGKTLDTAAFQKAIDEGGMVYVPGGVYKIGTLYLKSNGGLHLDADCILKASHCREDYNADDFCEQNEVFRSEHVTGAHLITAVEQENITIEGHGTIDGQGDFWMNESRMQRGWPDAEERDYVANDERPGQMIYICECKDVHITDVNIVNGPYWHLFFHGCDNVIARGLSIHGDRPRWTNDGIDIDSCSRVTVSDCVIDVGDDGITLRAHNKALKNKKVCERVTITNCVVHSHRDCGMRIGVGSGKIQNCVISNMDIEAPNQVGVGIVGRWSENSKTAATTENIFFTNLNIRARRALEICVAHGENPLPNECHIDNISFDNVMLCPREDNILHGFKHSRLTNVKLSNVTVKNGGEISIKNADGVVFDGFRDLSETPCNITAQDCTDVYVNGKMI